MNSRSETTLMSIQNLYLITVNCQQKKRYIDKDSIDEVILYLKMNINEFHIHQDVYERSGKYNQLHYHAIVKVPKWFKYRAYTSFGDKAITGSTYQIRWAKIYNLQGAQSYLMKDLRYQTQEDIFVANEYSIYRISENSPFKPEVQALRAKHKKVLKPPTLQG